jgi:L-ascorbate 6-phosphate lactonase
MVRLTWLGQAGFLIDMDGVRLLIDPCLTPQADRAYDPPEDLAPYIDDIQWVLVTHEHADHFDRQSLPKVAEASPAMRLAAPRPVIMLVSERIAVDRRVSVSPHDEFELSAGCRVTVIPAVHALTSTDPFTDGDDGSGPRFVGYMLHVGNVSIYHAGDTVITDAVRAAVIRHAPEVVVLPINGRDVYRAELGLVGNMDAREAARFAAEVGAHTLIPMHWDMFHKNSVRPAAVVDEVLDVSSSISVLIPARFQEVVIAP